MSRLDPSVASIRNAVRAALSQLTPPASAFLGASSGAGLPGASPLVLVACSGGADSLALAATTAFVAPRIGWRCGLITVDHGLQEGSDLRAKQIVQWGQSAGLDPSVAVEVSVGRQGGPEAAAREARYRALVQVAQEYAATCVLLGHTEDDQAETVLLALARGAGPRGLAAMPPSRSIDGVLFLRPLLATARTDCRNACAAMVLAVWEDPHNVDPAYARSRVRADLMPVLVEALGPDVVPNLARTAALVAADAEYLDELASVALGQCTVSDGGLSVSQLGQLPSPVRSRVLHAWAASLGAPRAALSHRHIEALDRLVTHWHGQGPTNLPGEITVARHAGVLTAKIIASSGN